MVARRLSVGWTGGVNAFVSPVVIIGDGSNYIFASSVKYGPMTSNLPFAGHGDFVIFEYLP